jgi:hypothetical protein
MEDFNTFLDKSKYTSLVSIVNLVCEISEKKTKRDKHAYALNIFQTVLAELKAHNRISDTLYHQCKNLSASDIDDAITDTIQLWNKVVPLFKRIRRWVRMCRN